MMNFKTYSILWTVLFCFGFPSGVFGQYIQKEIMKGTDPDNPGTLEDRTFAVIYSDGLPESARWGPGVKMTDDYGRTIRHQVSKGNGRNLSVNDRVPFRFVVAPTDLADNNAHWMSATGTDKHQADNNENFDDIQSTGCYRYGASDKPGYGRKWRLPTQRELQLMWLFRDAIGLIYSSKPMEEAGKTKKYLSSTEDGPNNCWYCDFIPGGILQSDVQLKTEINGTMRCVSDY